MKEIPKSYAKKIKERSAIKYICGYISRLIIYCKYCVFRNIARCKGATIGNNSNISFHIALNANHNLIVGEDCIINAKRLDLRATKIIIHDHVIINKDVEILRLSHAINKDSLFTTQVYGDLNIGDYSWLATGTKVLPQVSLIEDGVICGAYSVISKDCKADGVYVGNPAVEKKKHTSRFTDLVVCSLQGGDFNYYRKARQK